MELDPNSNLNSLSSRPAERSGIWWVTVIAIGILIGNILSFGTYELYQRWRLDQFMVTVNAMIDRQAKHSEKLRQQMTKERGVNAQLQQTCKFWRQQVQQENTEKNRNYRDIACARANNLFR